LQKEAILSKQALLLDFTLAPFEGSRLHVESGNEVIDRVG
jgi:hypothetical protein